MLVRIACSVLAVTGLLVAAGSIQAEPPAKDLQGDPLPDGTVARFGTTRWRHDTAVTFAAFLPEGKSIVCVSQDGAIRVWEFPSGKEIRRAGGSKKGMKFTAAALAPDGKTIATNFNITDGTKLEQEIHVHEVATGKELTPLKVESPAINDLAFSPDSRSLTSRDTDGTVRVWDWADAREVTKFASPVPPSPTRTTGPRTIEDLIASRGLNLKKDLLAYAPDGKSLVFYGLSQVPRFVEFPTGKEISAGVGHTEPILSVEFTSGGKQVVTTANDGSVYTWDGANHKDLVHMKVPHAATGRWIVSPDGRFAVDWPTTSALLGGGFGGGGPVGPGGGGGPGGGRMAAAEASVVDLASGKEIGKIEDKARGRLYMSSPKFSPDGKMLAATSMSDLSVELYDVASAKLLRSLDVDKNNLGGGFGGRSSSSVPNLLFSHDSKILAFQKSLNATEVTLFDVATGKEISTIPLPENTETPEAPNPVGRIMRRSTPLQASFSPDDRCLVIVSGGQTTLFELATGKPRRTFDTKPAEGVVGVPASLMDAGPIVAVSPNGRLVARSGGPDGTVRLLDTVTGKELTVLQGHTATVTAVAFAPDGKTLVSASVDTTALVWDIEKFNPAVAPEKAPSNADLEKCWQALTDDDAIKAFRAMADLGSAPKEMVARFKEQIKPAAALDKKQIAKLLVDLNDEDFATRAKATAELGKIDERLLPMLEKALTADPTQESRQRLEELRGKLTGRVTQGERLRVLRAIEVLERIGTPEAKELLGAVGEWSASAPLSGEARASLERLGK